MGAMIVGAYFLQGKYGPLIRLFYQLRGRVSDILHHNNTLKRGEQNMDSVTKVNSWMELNQLKGEMWASRSPFENERFQLSFDKYAPSTHTTPFWRSYDVLPTFWTLYRRWNNVVCVQAQCSIEKWFNTLITCYTHLLVIFRTHCIISYHLELQKLHFEVGTWLKKLL